MSTELEKTGIFKADGVQLVDHDLGTVVLFNTNLATPKTIAIMLAALDNGGFESEGHGLMNVIFRIDGRPIAVKKNEMNSWMFYPNSYSAVCNLQDCVEMAIRDSQSAVELSECVGVYALTWKNIIQGFFHETHHANAYLQDGDKLWTSAESRAEEEEKAEEYARNMIFNLAKSIDLEVEFSEDVASMVDTFLVEELEEISTDPKATEQRKRWALTQNFLRDNGGVFYDPPANDDDVATHMKTFKEFLHMCSGDAENSTEWATMTAGVQVGLSMPESNENADGEIVTQNTTILGDVPWSEDNDDDEYNIPVSGFQGVGNFKQTITPAAKPQAQAVQASYVPPIQQTVMAAINQEYAPQLPVNQTAVPVAPTGINQAVVVGANAYEPITLPAGIDPKTVVYGLYLKIFGHIFQGCQYNPTNPQMPFHGVGNIVNWLQLDQYEALFVKEMTCYSTDGKGTWCPGTKVKGAISGIMIDKARTLPAYELTLSMMNGTQIKRKFIPQNPNKTVNGIPTKTAEVAKAGNQILWIIDPDSKEYSVRVYNGVVQQNVGGNWS